MAQKKNQPDKEFQFSGYASPNFTPIPDQLLDEHLALLTGAEIKVVLYICRRTFGFKRDSDNISLNQMLSGIVKKDGTRLDHGTGLSKSTLLKALKSLADKNIIIAEQRSSTRKGNEPTNYRLNVKDPLGIKNDLGVSENYTPLGIKNDLALDRKLDQALGIKIDPTINSSTTNSNTKDSNNNNKASTKNKHEVSDVVVALHSRGIAQRVAQKLSKEYEQEYIQEKIEYYDFLMDERTEEIKKPSAWLRKAIEDDYSPPDGFISAQDREYHLKEQEERKQRFLEAQQRQAESESEARKAWEDEKRAVQQKIQAEYGTTDQDRWFWEEIIREIQFSTNPTVYSLVADSFILKFQPHQVHVAVSSNDKRAQLDHPGIQTAIKRAIKNVTDREVALEFISIE